MLCCGRNSALAAGTRERPPGGLTCAQCGQPLDERDAVRREPFFDLDGDPTCSPRLPTVWKRVVRGLAAEVRADIPGWRGKQFLFGHVNLGPALLHVRVAWTSATLRGYPRLRELVSVDESPVPSVVRSGSVLDFPGHDPLISSPHPEVGTPCSVRSRGGQTGFSVLPMRRRCWTGKGVAR